MERGRKACTGGALVDVKTFRQSKATEKRNCRLSLEDDDAIWDKKKEGIESGKGCPTNTGGFVGNWIDPLAGQGKRGVTAGSISDMEKPIRKKTRGDDKVHPCEERRNERRPSRHFQKN